MAVRNKSQFDPEKVTYFGETDARGKRVKFGIKAKDRARHMYVLGKTGMGKSVLLENMAVQDIQSGEGTCFIDPHGASADLLLDFVPENRIKDVLYFAPFDMEHPIAFNVMEDVGYDKRHLVVSGLMSTFKKIWEDAWSARMEYILSNTLLALLEYPGATLLAVNRMLADKEFRKRVVDNVKDPSVKAFWVDEFAKYTDRFAAEATPAIQNKVGQFTSNPLIRNIIGQPKSSFDVRKMMDEKKILIINLSKGRVGESNANLLGSMMITRIYLSAMSRADVSEATMNTLPNFYLYVDEFQSFANETFADILSEARKYKLNLTIAHQFIEQMTDEVRAAVFGNVGTMTVFRVGAYDAEVLEKEFFPTFTAEDLVNLGKYQIYLKLMIDGASSQPFSASSLPPIPKPPTSHKEQIIEESRAQFSKPRAIIEEDIIKWHAPVSPVRAPAMNSPRPPFQGGPQSAPVNMNRPAMPPPFRASVSPLPQNPVRPAPQPQVPASDFIPKKPFAQVFQNLHTAATPPPQAQMPRKPEIQPAVLHSKSPAPSNIQQKQSTAGRENVSLPPRPAAPNAAPKKPVGKNLNSLREALEKLQKENSGKAASPVARAVPEEKKTEPEKKKPETAAEEKKPEEKEKTHSHAKKSNEVPEDVLRNILNVKHDGKKD